MYSREKFENLKQKVQKQNSEAMDKDMNMGN